MYHQPSSHDGRSRTASRYQRRASSGRPSRAAAAFATASSNVTEAGACASARRGEPSEARDGRPRAPTEGDSRARPLDYRARSPAPGYGHARTEKAGAARGDARPVRPTGCES